MKTEEITCPRCGSRHIKKNGITRQKKQRYRCYECGKQFLFCLSYRYRAYVVLLRQLIVPMALNGSGIRDTSRVLGISINTVLKVLRCAANAIKEPRIPMCIKDLEMDEQWSFVQNKKQQHWLWYSFNRRTKRVAAFVLGRRTDRNCRSLCKKLKLCQVQTFYTDHWKSYAKSLPSKNHQIGKKGTQNIERCNLNFRTHLKRLQRRTICFSKSYEMHYNVIKLYINHINNPQHHF